MAKKSSGKWMQKAFSKNKGKLHRITGTPEGEKIPAKKLAAQEKKADKTGDTKLAREVSLAKTGKRIASGQDTALMGGHGRKGGHCGYGR